MRRSKNRPEGLNDDCLNCGKPTIGAYCVSCLTRANDRQKAWKHHDKIDDQPLFIPACEAHMGKRPRKVNCGYCYDEMKRKLEEVERCHSNQTMKNPPNEPA